MFAFFIWVIVNLGLKLKRGEATGFVFAVCWISSSIFAFINLYYLRYIFDPLDLMEQEWRMLTGLDGFILAGLLLVWGIVTTFFHDLFRKNRLENLLLVGGGQILFLVAVRVIRLLREEAVINWLGFGTTAAIGAVLFILGLGMFVRRWSMGPPVDSLEDEDVF